MPRIDLCDICGSRTDKNAGKDGVTSIRGPLTVHIKVVKANGSEPIVCEHCVRLAAYYPQKGAA